MPMAQQPYKIRCLVCGWQKSVYPDSDVLIPGHSHFDHCPKCHSDQLERSSLSFGRQLVSQLQRMLRGRS